MSTVTGRARVLCPIDGCTFDPCTDYAGEVYPHPSTRRHYCRDACRKAGAAHYAQQRAAEHAAGTHRQRLSALEAAGQLAVLTREEVTS